MIPLLPSTRATRAWRPALRLVASRPRLAFATESCWLLAAVAVPFACNPWGSSPFELPKAALLRLLVLLLLVAAVRGQSNAAQSEPQPARRALFWAALAYLAALILATAFSREPRVSLFGSLERQQGLLTQACYVILFALTANALRSWEQVGRLWRALVWGSAPVVAYGLLQAAGLDPAGWRSDGASPVLSTLGRSNFLGGYLVLAIALTAGLSVVDGRPWRYRVLLAAQLLCLALTRARSAWLGAAVVAVAFALALLPRRVRWLLPVALGAGLALVLVLALAGEWTLGEGSLAARVAIWRASLRLLGERPLLGLGPEVMLTAFYRVFPPELVYYQGRNVVVDRAHNLWLDLGLSTGAVGVAAFAAVLVAGVRTIWRGYRRAPGRSERFLWLALLGAIAGHVADLQSSFELTGSAVVFWLILALVAAMDRLPERRVESEAARPAAVRPAVSRAWPAVALSALLAGVTVALPLLADTYAGASQRRGAVLGQRLEAARVAARLWPLEPEYRLRLALLLDASGDVAGADREMAAAVARRPADPRHWLAQGGLFAAHREDPARLPVAELAYREAIARAPNLATFHTTLGLLLASEGRLAESGEELRRAVALDVTDYYAYDALAAVYAAGGQADLAAEASNAAAYWRARTAPD